MSKIYEIYKDVLNKYQAKYFDAMENVVPKHRGKNEFTGPVLDQAMSEFEIEVMLSYNTDFQSAIDIIEDFALENSSGEQKNPYDLMHDDLLSMVEKTKKQSNDMLGRMLKK